MSAGDERVVLADDGGAAEGVRGVGGGDVGLFCFGDGGGGGAAVGEEALVQEAEDGFDVGAALPVVWVEGGRRG